MKIAILGDTHWGGRSDAPIFYKHYEKFYGHFFKHLYDEKVTHVIQTGDTFDSRKKINLLTLQEAKRIFFSTLDAGFKTFIAVGNHDIYHRESVALNSPSILLTEYDNIVPVTKPRTIDFGGTTIDIIPWICKENEEEIIKFIEESKSDYCVGHFEIAGFAMYLGDEEKKGLSFELFSKYKKVWTGHYHTKSERGNIAYVGTPYEMTWSDYGDPKGYHIFDTETEVETFYENPDKIFVKLEYDDTDGPVEVTEDLTDKFVRVIVLNKTDPKLYDKYLQRIGTMGAYDVKYADDMSEFMYGEIDTEVTLEDTVSVMTSYVDSLDNPLSEQMKRLLTEVYIEAINAEAA